MGMIINLTQARQITQNWERLLIMNPYDAETINKIKELSMLSGFKDLVQDIIQSRVNMDNIDLICYLVEEYYPDLFPLLKQQQYILYISRRIENCRRYIQNEELDNYQYAFPETKFNKNDTRVHFLESVLSYIDILSSDHQTIAELLNTPLQQYEQMVHFIVFFPHEKIPVLLEKLSYYDKPKFCQMTIKPIGNFKNEWAVRSLKNLEAFYKGKNVEMLPLIYKTMQKCAFHRPHIG